MAALSLETERKLVDFLDLVAEGEREVESSRLALSENRDFDPYTAFKTIDRVSIGYISYLDIRDFLDRNRVSCTNQEIKSLIKQYDSDNDSRLTLTEFHQLALPSTNDIVRDIALQRPPSVRLSLDAEFLLARLFDKELSFQRRLELSKRDLSLRYDFTYISGFSSIDYPATSFITRNKLYDYFRRNGRVLLEANIDAILRRMDIDGDERLSYSEFSDFVRPQEPPAYTSSPSRSPTRSSPIRSSPSKASPVRHSSPLRRSGGSPSRTTSFMNNESSMRSSSFSRSPLTVGEESELVSIFFQQINLERDLNSAKKEVALCPDFNLLDCFQMFDLNDVGYVSEMAFEDCLFELAIRPTQEEIGLVFKHYSSLGNYRLSYSEFSKLFTPTEPEYYRMITNRTPYNVPRSERRRVFSADTQYRLTRTLKLHLETENVAESLRHRLAIRPSFSMHEAFQAVDRDRNGYITYDEFKLLLEQHGIFATIKDVESLMDRYDKNKDGRVSYSEFLDEVTPKSPKKY